MIIVLFAIGAGAIFGGVCGFYKAPVWPIWLSGAAIIAIVGLFHVDADARSAMDSLGAGLELCFLIVVIFLWSVGVFIGRVSGELLRSFVR